LVDVDDLRGGADGSGGCSGAGRAATSFTGDGGGGGSCRTGTSIVAHEYRLADDGEDGRGSPGGRIDHGLGKRVWTRAV
jgi:hypothetical protein